MNGVGVSATGRPPPVLHAARSRSARGTADVSAEALPVTQSDALGTETSRRASAPTCCSRSATRGDNSLPTVPSGPVLSGPVLPLRSRCRLGCLPRGRWLRWHRMRSPLSLTGGRVGVRGQDGEPQPHGAHDGGVEVGDGRAAHGHHVAGAQLSGAQPLRHAHAVLEQCVERQRGPRRRVDL